MACFGGNTMANAVPGESTYPKNPEPRYMGIFSLVRIQKYPIGTRAGKGASTAKVTDGMSNTVMLSEILTWNEVTETGGSVDEGVPQGNDDWRGAWMIPSVGASAFTGRFPPNASGSGPDFRGGSSVPRVDQIPACGTGLDETSLDVPCREEMESANIWASARSKHNQGVNAAMGDGSVTFISDDIEAFVWHALCTRAGEDVASQ